VPDVRFETYTDSSAQASSSLLLDPNCTVIFMSANRKTITILTSPATSTKSLPPFPGARASPTTGAPKQYRIEERKRTVYVTSDLDPSEWDAEQLDAVFNMAEAQQGEHERPGGSQPMRRARSLVETQFIITEDTSPNQATDGLSPSGSLHSHGRRGVKSTGHLYHGVPAASPDSPRRSRPRILFYHKHDPHYGFTNFSAHPVTYMGKRYPTSEHLFQSFKVSWLISLLRLISLSGTVSWSQTQPRRAHQDLLREAQCCIFGSTTLPA
jgi:hypothetical protein